MDLFEYQHTTGTDPGRPLADRMRPQSLAELVGQEHLTAEDSLLSRAIAEDRVFSILLWGPPGCGKTTLAGIIARSTRSEFIRISAVLSGVKDIRQVIETAQKQKKLYQRKTILFVDEIHRFNKAQQDAFLLHVENGLITLVGATTQNPSFEVIPALVSRCRVFALHPIKKQGMCTILKTALMDKDRGLGMPEDSLSKNALAFIADLSQGDARAALTSLEGVVTHLKAVRPIRVKDVESIVQKKALLYDKAGEEHFNLISAFIKSMRGSDPDAAVYWLERMLSAGDDPYYVLRRMIRFATEDIGLADPGALTMALNADDSYRKLGPPEGEEVLFQAAVYLATAPKSNAVYTARKAVKKAVEKTGYAPVPFHLRNAPTRLMKEMGYGDGYQYAHDFPDAVVQQDFLPEEVRDQEFYKPTDRGYEKTVSQRLAAWKARRKNRENHS